MEKPESFKSAHLQQPKTNEKNPAHRPKQIKIRVNLKKTEKSTIKIKSSEPYDNITACDFDRFLMLLEMANLGIAPSREQMDLPDLLIETFIRVLIKKRYIIEHQTLEWTAATLHRLLSIPVIKKKEESLKFIVRETFNILGLRYRSLHYFYWNRVNPASSLKVEREKNYVAGFNLFYFGELIRKNRDQGIPDSIANYMLPNKQVAELKSRNKSLTPKFLKRVFGSSSFARDFLKVLNSPVNGFVKKSLRSVLFADASSKIRSWRSIFETHKEGPALAVALKKKVAGSKAKLPWFRSEIEGAIETVGLHIQKVRLGRDTVLFD